MASAGIKRQHTKYGLVMHNNCTRCIWNSKLKLEEAFLEITIFLLYEHEFKIKMKCTVYK